MRNTIMYRAISGLALLALVGCSDTKPPISGLSYTDPTPGKYQWALKKTASSTPTHLILDLIPPVDGESGFGTGLNLTVDQAKASFTKVDPTDSELTQSGSYDLGSGMRFIKTAKADGDLMIGVFQKGISTKPALHDLGRVLSIAIEPVQPMKEGSISLRVRQAKELRTEGMVSIDVAVGTLEVR